MKRLLLLLGMLVTCISFYGVPVKYVGCTPENGSSISSFDITLNFDIADAIADLGDGKWGLGYGGDSSSHFTTLYEGNQESGTALATIMTSNFNGKSEGFTINNNTIQIEFSNTIVIKNGQLYTLVISNNFSLYQKGKVIPKATLKFEENPLVLSFIGKGSSSENLALQEISITDNAQLESIKDVRFTFNAPISVNANIKAQIKEGETTVAEVNSMTVENDNILVADFGEEVPLSYGHSYNMYLPEGAVVLASDATKTNKAFSVNVNGTKTYYYSNILTNPSDGDKCLPSKASISYGLPKGTNIAGGPNQATDRNLKVYKSEISDENFVCSLSGSTNSDRIGIEWDLSNVIWEPSTKYFLVREKGLGYLFDADNKRLPEWTNDETVISFTTPSVEEADIAPLEFGNPVIGNHKKGTPFEEGMSLGSINYLDIAPKSSSYVAFIPHPKAQQEGRMKGSLYEITNEGDVLIKEFGVNTADIDNIYDFYYVIRANIDAVFYEGKNYRIVIPEGLFTAGSSYQYNYVLSPELSYTLKGSTPSEIASTGCSITEGETVSRLYNITWSFKGNLDLKDEAYATMKITYTNGSPGGEFKLPLFRSRFSGANTNIQAICTMLNYDGDGKPVEFVDGWKVSVTIPEGSIFAAADESIINKDIVVNFLGATPKPEVLEPEYVTVGVNVNGIHTTSQEFVKGKTFKLQLAHDDWEVESLRRFNGDADETGTDVFDYITDGVYTSSAIKDNTRFVATLKYAKSLVFDNTTGVADLEDLNLRVYSEKENIVVEGLQGGEHITVYSMAGLVIGEHDVSATYDELIISAAKGQAYIVRIQRGDKVQAAKIMH